MLRAVFGTVPGRLAIVLGLLVVLSGGMMALGATDDAPSTGPEAALPSVYPAFVMELETVVDGTVLSTSTLTYTSATDWFYEVFSPDGAFVSSERFASGKVTITSGRYGVLDVIDVDPAAPAIPVAWFVPSMTMLGRGADRVGSSPEFRLDVLVPCGVEDHRCSAGESSLRVVTLAKYDLSTGIPTGYTESHNGSQVGEVRVTRLEVD